VPNYASGNVIIGGKLTQPLLSIYYKRAMCPLARIERENKLSPFDFATKISEHFVIQIYKIVQ
jgi:hypothetical protein